jgi:hypothetical protein
MAEPRRQRFKLLGVHVVFDASLTPWVVKLDPSPSMQLSSRPPRQPLVLRRQREREALNPKREREGPLRQSKRRTEQAAALRRTRTLAAATSASLSLLSAALLTSTSLDDPSGADGDKPRRFSLQEEARGGAGQVAGLGRRAGGVREMHAGWARKAAVQALSDTATSRGDVARSVLGVGVKESGEDGGKEGMDGQGERVQSVDAELRVLMLRSLMLLVGVRAHGDKLAATALAIRTRARARKVRVSGEGGMCERERESVCVVCCVLCVCVCVCARARVSHGEWREGCLQRAKTF